MRQQFTPHPDYADLRHEQLPSAAPRRTGAIDYRRLRVMVSIQDVLELIGWTPVSRHGPQLRGPCPLHKSRAPRSRVFSVSLEKNAFHCFKCDAGGNQLDLWMKITELPVYDAAIDLCRRLGAEPPWLDRA